jgi:hypothetical protein
MFILFFLLFFSVSITLQPAIAESCKESDPNCSQQKVDLSQDLGFIRYSTTGWVKDDLPPRGEFSTCQVLTRTFFCLTEEKKRYEAFLKNTEKELKSLPNF